MMNICALDPHPRSFPHEVEGCLSATIAANQSPRTSWGADLGEGFYLSVLHLDAFSEQFASVKDSALSTQNSALFPSALTTGSCL